MDAAIDLSTLSQVTGVPHATLRYWVGFHGWKALGRGPHGAKLYDAVAVMAVAKQHPAFLRRLEAEAAQVAA